MADFNISTLSPALTASGNGMTINTPQTVTGKKTFEAGIIIDPSGLPGSPVAGDIVIDSGASNAFKWYDGTTWQSAGGGSAAGSDGQLQYNNAGVFGGANLVYSGATVSGTVGGLGIGAAPIAGHKLNVYGFFQVRAAGGDASISIWNTTATAGDAGMARIVLAPQNNATQEWIVGVDGRISFRAGGDPPLEGMALWPSRSVTIGGFGADPSTIRLSILGSGTTATTAGLSVQDSAGNAGLTVLDNRSVLINSVSSLTVSGVTPYFQVIDTAGSNRAAIDIRSNTGFTANAYFSHSDTHFCRWNFDGPTGSTPGLLNIFMGSGVTTPAYRFDTGSGGSFGGTLLMREGNAGIGVGNTISTPGSRLVVKGSDTSSSASALNITDSANASALFVRNDRFVGVGTTAPDSLLHVKKDHNGLTKILVENNANGTAARAVMSVELTPSGGPFVSITMAAASADYTFNGEGGYGHLYTGSTTAGLLLTTFGNKPFILKTDNVERLRVLGTGNLGVGESSPGSRLAVKGIGTTLSTSALNVTNSSSLSLLFVRDDGKVGIGTSAPVDNLDISGVTPQQAIVDGSGNAYGGALRFMKSRGTVASPTSANSGDEALTIVSRIHNGSAFSNIASIRAIAAGTPSGTSTPGYLTFNTTPVGSLSDVERVRVTSDGNVGIGMTPSSIQRFVSRGIGTTTGFSAVFQNSSGTTMLSIRDDGKATFNAANTVAIINARGAGTTGATSLVRLEDSAGTVRLFMQDDGLNGFNTSTPTDIIDVLSTGSGFGFKLTGSASGTNAIGGLREASNNGGRFILRASSGATDTVEILGDGDSFFNGGDVGIGLSTLPAAVRLTTRGEGTTSASAAFQAQDSAGTSIFVARNDGQVTLRNGVFVNEFSSDTTLGGNSNLAVPTEAAVKAYVDARNIGTTVFTRDAVGASLTLHPLGINSTAYQPVRAIHLTGLTVVGNSSLGTGSLTVTVYKNSDSVTTNIVFEVTTSLTSGAFRLTDFTVNNATTDAITASDTFFVKVTTGALTAIDDLAGFIDHTVD